MLSLRSFAHFGLPATTFEMLQCSKKELRALACFERQAAKGGLRLDIELSARHRVSLAAAAGFGAPKPKLGEYHEQLRWVAR
jgi:hypothetical protein